METTRLSSKGQLILPKWLRDRYNWREGDEFIVIDTGHGVMLEPSRPFAPARLDEVMAIIAYDGPAYTVEEMDEAVAASFRKGDDDRD
ncbi:Transcriptional regulator, AbrB family [Candidatus Promineifilum breve]|uniref:Transcriptional regulator, AbrB family n=1 Tax=Candidatus Promineifilum breve TaxID=1806508 RepID=A0A170PJV9_9CHLR|nr:AbrB/MazE/SpoVT family DNA-binding domain-containing protein [Candidatus Promineifilum breve]CUS06037.1 Transcriptional regulator, AbrB family [Candidatus Promineifilum breve]